MISVKTKKDKYIGGTEYDQIVRAWQKDETSVKIEGRVVRIVSVSRIKGDAVILVDMGGVG